MKRLTVFLMLLTLVSCFHPKGYEEALTAFQQKDWDKAATSFAKLVIDHPDNVEYKVKWEMAKSNAAKAHSMEGRRALMKGDLDLAAKELNRSIMFDPSNHYVHEQLKTVLQKIRDRDTRKQQAGTQLERMEKDTRGAVGVPMLQPSSDAPIDLHFAERTSLKDIYRSLGMMSGVNVLFDSSFQDTQITIDLRGMSFYNALKSLMVANGNFYKVIDEHTIIILKDTKQNHDKYDDKIIKVFYLSYADPTELKNNVRLLTGIKEVFENKDLNCVVVMGTPQQIAIANRIVSLNDKPKAEVLVDFELLEVNRSNLDQLGIMPTDGSNPAYQVGGGLFSDSSDSDSLLPGFVDPDSSIWKFAVPLLQLDFLKSIGNAKDVSSPTVRVSEGETGKILIGQSVPIATTTFTPFTSTGVDTSAYSSVGGQPYTSYNYQEVGIKIDVEPRVHHNGDISLKLKLEISSVVDNRDGFQPVIGKRTVETVLRVKSGEVVVFAGLLKDVERTSLNGIKGLADIPILGKLFSNTKKELEQSDIMMSITPHIVRGPNIQETDMMPYMVGSQVESNFSPMDPFAYGPAAQGTMTETTEPVEENLPPDQGRMELKPPPPISDGPDAQEPVTELAPAVAKPIEQMPEPSIMPAMLSMTPRRIQVDPGLTVVQSLFATSFKNVDSVDLVIQFDPEKLEIVDAMDGGFLGEDGAAVSFVPVWDNLTGRLAITIDRKGAAKGRTGTGMLANIVWKGKTTGASSITMMTSSRITGAEGDGMPFRFVDAEVTVR